ALNRNSMGNHRSQTDRKSPTRLGLLTFSELPEWRRDNPCILTGYRPETNSWKECFKGVLLWHNQTVNIWSHLIGTIISCALLSLSFLRDDWSIFERLDVLHDYAGQPVNTPKAFDGAGMMLFIFGCVVCFACSTVFHSAMCHSESVRILVLGTLNYFSTFHYAFYCDPSIRNIYIAMMTISGCTGIYLVYSPSYASPAYRRMRTYTFFALGFVVIFPFIHAIHKYGVHHVSRGVSLKWLFIEALAYVCGALMYAEKCPEFLVPGRFDYGASHQIFHVCSMVATFSHYVSLSRSYQFWLYGPGTGICPAI
ncbi:hemolysin-III related-domain-containing protein, partial [Rhodocollybia butyracea]